MFTSGVSRSLRDVHRADETTARLGRELMTGKKLGSAADAPSAWLGAQRAGSTAGFLDAIHTGLNEAATSIRVADQTMAAIAQHLQIMQGQVEQAMQYPPGNPARNQSIADFNTVRGQLDELVNTAKPDTARNLMGAGSLNVLVGLHGEHRTVHAQAVDPGPAGLNLPMLDPNSDLTQALADVKSAQLTLGVRRQGLGSDAADITRYEAQNARVTSFYESHAESLTAADPAETAVKLQSVDVQRSLAMQTLGGISNLRSAVLELLR